MSFNEWINELYGCEVDLCDMSEDEVADLYEEWEKETK